MLSMLLTQELHSNQRDHVIKMTEDVEPLLAVSKSNFVPTHVYEELYQ